MKLREVAPFAVALWLGACALFTPPKLTPDEELRVRDLAVCVAAADVTCGRQRPCLDAELLRCAALARAPRVSPPLSQDPTLGE